MTEEVKLCNVSESPATDHWQGSRYSHAQATGLSTLPDIIWESPDFEPYLPVSIFMSVISRFLGVSCGLQINICNLPDNWRSLLFVIDSTFWRENPKCLALFLVRPPPPPPSTEPQILALMRRLCTALCYWWPGKSYSPYLKTWEVDSPEAISHL